MYIVIESSQVVQGGLVGTSPFKRVQWGREAEGTLVADPKGARDSAGNLDSYCVLGEEGKRGRLLG